MSEMCSGYKAFDTIWHDELTHKTKCVGINDMFFKLIKNEKLFAK